MIGDIRACGCSGAMRVAVAVPADSLVSRPSAPIPPPPPDLLSTVKRPKGHVPAVGEWTTMDAVVVDILSDRSNPRNGLSHQVLMVEVDAITDGPEVAANAGPTGTSVRGRVIELDNDITPSIGTRASVVQGQPISVRGVLYHNDAHGDKPARDGIHWTHHAIDSGDAGYIRTCVSGELVTYD